MRARRMFSCVLVAVLVLAGGHTGVFAQDDGGVPRSPVLGVINIVVADVFVTPRDGGDEIRLIASSVLDPGETLRTDENGGALVTLFYDGTEVVLAPESRLTLNSFSGNAADDFVIDMELHQGHLVGGVGDVAAEVAEDGEWTIATPDFVARPLEGLFELTVTPEGDTRLIVIDGRVDVLAGDAAPFPVEAGQFIEGAPGATATISADGVTPTDSLIESGVCTATTPVNLNVRYAPNEDSLRLGGVAAEQVFWVRAATEGRLWLQVYFETELEGVDIPGSGWVYGPAVELDEAHCETLVRAPLDALIYGGFGVDEAAGAETETEPAATETPAE